MTSEFDINRRDADFFARELHGVGKLAGISDVAGVGHGWWLNGNIPKLHTFLNEWKSAFEAYTYGFSEDFKS